MEPEKISKRKVSIVNLLFNYANASFAIINGLILVPLYLTYFSVNTYGSFLSSGNIVSMLGLLEGGMSLVLTQKLSISYAKNDLISFSKLLGSGFFISLSLTSILIIVGLGLFPFIADWVKAEPSEARNLQFAFLISSLGAGLSITFNNISAVFQSWLKVHICGYTNLISIFVGVLCTLMGLYFGLGVISIPLGILARSVIGISILSLILRSNLKEKLIPSIKIEKSNCVELIRSILPVFGGNIAKSLVTNSQLLIITNFINPAASAIYVITGRIYQVCDTFLAPIGSSIYSSVSQIVGEGDIDKIKKNLINIFILFSAFSAFILSSSFALNSAFISLWVGADMYGGIILSALLCLNMLLSTRFNFLSMNLFALGIFGKTVLYDQIGGAIRLILIFTLIKQLGYIAVPLAEFLSTSLLVGYFINKLTVRNLSLSGKESLKFIFSGISAILFSFGLAFVWQLMIPSPESWLLFILHSLIFAVLVVIPIVFMNRAIQEIVMYSYLRVRYKFLKY